MYIGKSRKDLARSDFQKVKAERLGSMPGLSDIRPARGQSDEQFSNDLDRIAETASERMAEAVERRRRLDAEKRRPKPMPTASQFSEMVESRERREYDGRKISL